MVVCPPQIPILCMPSKTNKSWQVRATVIVLKAYQSGCVPPAVSIHELSSQFKKLDLEELREVFSLQHLIRFVEHMFFNQKIGNDNLFGYCMTDTREPPRRGQEEVYKNRFYRAMYRLLLAGAMLAGAMLARAYTEPVFQAKEEGRSEFLKHCKEDRFPLEDFESRLTDEDVEFLRQLPVYNFDLTDDSEIGQWRNREYEAYFGLVASWLVEDGRAKGLSHEPALYSKF
jgi:hypothetical protein